MKAGFLSFRNKKNKTNYSLGELVKYTKKSESKLISNYEEMSKATREYAEAFQDHAENLEQIDDRVNFNGMVTLFNKIIMKDNIHSGKIDKSSPILFRNYKIEGDVTSSTFRTEHLERQLYYLLNKYSEPRNSNFIKYMTITDITKTSCVVNIITIDNKKYKKKVDHEDYILDKNDVKTILHDVIDTTKKNLKMQNNIILFNNNSKSIFSKKSVSVKSNKSRRKSRSKSGSKSKNRSKKRSVKKNQNLNVVKNNNNKKMEEIDLFASSNSNKRLSHLSNSIKNVFKTRNAPKKFSFDKTKSEKDRNAKKIANAKAAAEAKAKEIQFPPKQDNLVSQKCAALKGEQECRAAAPECYFTKYQTCIKSTMPPFGQGQGQAQATKQAYTPPTLLIPSSNNNKKQLTLGETKI